MSFSYAGNKKQVINNLSFEFEKGMVYSIMGKSGAGKTTLLSLLSGLLKPTKGEIKYNDENIAKIDQYKYRSKNIGVIFQSFNLLPHLTALENVVLSMDISGKKIGNKIEKAKDLLKSVGLDEETFHKKILKLSGGQQQRVAIARTLSYDPDLILADEPTGNLDIETQDSIMEIFSKLAHEKGKCVILVTHSPEVGDKSDETLHL